MARIVKIMFFHVNLTDELDMLLLGVLASSTDNSARLSTWKKGDKGKKDRERTRTYYRLGNKQVCQHTFAFFYR